MIRKAVLALVFPLVLLEARSASAFCGFYVAKADAKLFNKASQVVLVRNEDRTVLTMSNDFRGDPKEFAVVIPVPTFIERGQIHVADRALVEHLDAYTSPRLVEYFDPDPCERVYPAAAGAAGIGAASVGARRQKDSQGVTVEARYTVGEYDIVILSATQSGGLEQWLLENGYRIPQGASAVFGSYIKQGMHFFVAKVNLKEQAKLGYTVLRPIQVAYETPKFMLPIRLGTVNADGPQELLIYTLTRKGRVETTNYRTVRIPTDADVPLYVKDEFGPFYKSMFAEQVRREGMRTVFLEYAWNMNWCDPCAADPLSSDELRKLGVYWLAGGGDDAWQGPDVFSTRLHVRYDAAHFPEDLVFQETPDDQTFQGRYVMRHRWSGKSDCKEAKEYRKNLPRMLEGEAESLATLTGWPIEGIRVKMKIPPEAARKIKWWEDLWKD